MNINKSSWHYRVVQWGETVPAPSSLCPYVRKLVFKLGVYIALTIALIAFCVATGSGGAAALGLTGVLYWGCSFLIGAFGTTAVIGILAGIGFGVWYINEKRKERKEKKIEEREKAGIPPKPESLVVAWVKAKHNKICPSLEFKN